jgi:hypothetical protein
MYPVAVQPEVACRVVAKKYQEEPHFDLWSCDRAMDWLFYWICDYIAIMSSSSATSGF